MRIYYVMEARGRRCHVLSALAWTCGPGTGCTAASVTGVANWNDTTAFPPRVG